jgi:competence protein ComEC
MSSPFVIITLTYIIGIILENFITISLNFSLLIFVISLSISLYLLYKNRDIPALIILFNIFLLGFNFAKFSKIIPKNHIVNLSRDKKWCEIIGTVASEPEIKNNRVRFVLKSERIILNGEEKIASGKILVNFEGDNLKYGDIVKIKGNLKNPSENLNPNELSYRKILAQKNIYKIIYVKKENLEILGENKKFIYRIVKNILNFKNSLVENLKKSLPGKIIIDNVNYKTSYAELLASIIFGSKAVNISNELEEKFRETGIIHILVASGAQISLLLLFSLFILKFRPESSFNLALFSSFSLLLIISYGIMTGGDASIKRAVIMGIVYILAIILKKEYDNLNSLFFSAFLILIFSPQTLYSISFQLSFITCFGIIYFSPTLTEFLSKFKIKNFEKISYYIIFTISACISAQIFVWPVIAYYFNQVSLVSIISNIFVVPLVAFLLPMGILGSIIGFFPLKLAVFFNFLNGFSLFLLLKITLFFSNFQFSSIYVKTPSIFLIIFWYLFLISIVEIKNKNIKLNLSKEKLVIIFLFVLAFFTFFKLFQSINRPLTVTFLDVGEGDSIFIENKNGVKILVDGGGIPENLQSEYDVGERIVVPFLRRKGISKIDIVILTHPHNDHLQGLLSVLKNFKVGIVLDSGYENKENPLYYEFLSLIKEKNIRYKIVKYGDIFNLGSSKIKILNPQVPYLNLTKSDIDNNGIVFKLTEGNVRFLFTGDIYKEGECKILENGEDIESDILKIPHHGSNTSSSLEFLEKVKPKISIISVGRDNTYGHPSKEVIERIKKIGSSIYRTDKNGAIILKVKNDKIYIHTLN